MKLVREVSFIKSAGKDGVYPEHALPELAFAGRSNCGKSSLINTMVGRKRLARVSNTPGRTQLINFFQVDDQVMLVDLPGYGFAKVPLELKAAWGPMVERYLRGREQLAALVLLVDSRREPREEELRLRAWCRERALPVLYVATKVDKLKVSQRKLRLQKIARVLAVPAKRVVPFSSMTGEGREELWKRLDAFCGEGGA